MTLSAPGFRTAFRRIYKISQPPNQINHKLTQTSLIINLGPKFLSKIPLWIKKTLKWYFRHSRHSNSLDNTHIIYLNSLQAFDTSRWAFWVFYCYSSWSCLCTLSIFIDIFCIFQVWVHPNSNVLGWGEQFTRLFLPSNQSPTFLCSFLWVIWELVYMLLKVFRPFKCFILDLCSWIHEFSVPLWGRSELGWIDIFQTCG